MPTEAGLAENALATTGLADKDGDLWRRTADAYLWVVCNGRWGSIREPGRVKAGTQVYDVSANLLHGSKLNTLTRTNVESLSLAKAVEGLAEDIIRQVQTPASGAPTEAQRVSLSAELHQRAKQIGGPRPDQLGRVGHEDSQRLKHYLQLLEAALFLNPDDREASAAWMLVNFSPINRPTQIGPFRFQWKASEGWRRHFKRFGFEPATVTRLPARLADGPKVVMGNPPATAILSALQLLDSMDNREPPEGPAYGTPPQVRQQWAEQLVQDMLDWARSAAQLPEMKESAPTILRRVEDMRGLVSIGFPEKLREALGVVPATNLRVSVQPRPGADRVQAPIRMPQRVAMPLNEVVQLYQHVQDPGHFIRMDILTKWQSSTVEQLKSLTESGNPEAAYVLGWYQLREHVSVGDVEDLMHASRGESLDAGCAAYARKSMRVAAEAGMVEAQGALGMLYLVTGAYWTARNGMGSIEGDYGEVGEWLAKAAEKNHPGACFELGKVKFYGKLEREYPDVARLWLKAADLGHSLGAVWLVHLISDGHPGVHASLDPKVLRYVREEMDRGNPEAPLAMAKVCDLGPTGLRDKKAALNYYRAYLAGKPKDSLTEEVPSRIKVLLGELEGSSSAFAELKAQAERGSLVSQFEFGKALLSGKQAPQDEKQALEWLLKASRPPANQAEHFDQDTYIGECSFLLAGVYESGRIVPRDYATAFKYLEKAQTKMDFMLDSKYRLIRYYELGQGTKPDLERALNLYLDLVRVGYRDHDTVRDLAERATLLLRSGKLWPGQSTRIEAALSQFKPHLDHSSVIRLSAGGPPDDPVKARAYYQEIAQTRQRNPACVAAQKSLARMLLKGEGGSKDVEQAINWLAEAADAGDPEAFYLIGNAVGELEPKAHYPVNHFARAAYVHYAVAEALGYMAATVKKTALAKSLPPLELTAAGHEFKQRLEQVQQTTRR